MMSIFYKNIFLWKMAIANPGKLVRFISNAGNPFSRSEAKKFKPEVNALGFLLSDDTTGGFARCIASVPLSHRRRALKRVSSDVKFMVW